ncbi:MAG: hypothetical protein AAFV77_00620 [Planctomycetota bacterium]
MSAALSIVDARIASFQRLAVKVPDAGFDHVVDDLTNVRQELVRLIELGDRAQLFLPFMAGQRTINPECAIDRTG